MLFWILLTFKIFKGKKDNLSLKMAPTAQDPPLLNIPESDSAVEVHIINTTSHIKGLPTSRFFEPKIQGFDAMDCPAYSFLIEHPKGKKLLFDLGIRKDWKNLPPAVIGPIKRHGWEISVEKGVDEILEAGGVDPVDINGIIWRLVVHSFGF